MNGKPMPQEMIDLKNDLLSVGDRVFYDELEFVEIINPILKKYKLSKTQIRILLYNVLSEKDPKGSIYYDNKGKTVADSDLRDTENVPLVEDIDKYFAREVLPYAPDAWIDKSKTKVGYEIPMTRHFYEYQKPEKAEKILQRIIGLEDEIKKSLEEILK